MQAKHICRNLLIYSYFKFESLKMSIFSYKMAFLKKKCGEFFAKKGTMLKEVVFFGAD